MSEQNGKVCCNCRHNIRRDEDGHFWCFCEIEQAIQKIKDEIEHNNISDWIATQSVLDIIKKHTEEKK